MTRLHASATDTSRLAPWATGRPHLMLFLSLLLDPELFYTVPHQAQIKRTRDLEGPWERFTSLGEVETLGHRVQMRPTAGCPMRGIREDTSSGNRHP